MLTLVHLMDCTSFIFYQWVVGFLDCWFLEFYHNFFLTLALALGHHYRLLSFVSWFMVLTTVMLIFCGHKIKIQFFLEFISLLISLSCSLTLAIHITHQLELCCCLETDISTIQWTNKLDLILLPDDGSFTSCQLTKCCVLAQKRDRKRQRKVSQEYMST